VLHARQHQATCITTVRASTTIRIITAMRIVTVVRVITVMRIVTVEAVLHDLRIITALRIITVEVAMYATRMRMISTVRMISTMCMISTVRASSCSYNPGNPARPRCWPLRGLEGGSPFCRGSLSRLGCPSCLDRQRGSTVLSGSIMFHKHGLFQWEPRMHNPEDCHLCYAEPFTPRILCLFRHPRWGILARDEEGRDIIVWQRRAEITDEYFRRLPPFGHQPITEAFPGAVIFMSELPAEILDALYVSCGYGVGA
jgi:hypothetical protein